MLDSREPEEEAILAALMGITEMMGNLTDLEELLDAIVRIAPRLVSVDRCMIFLRNAREGDFRVAHAWSADAASMTRLMRLAISDRDMGKLVHKLVDQHVPVMLRAGREPVLPAPIMDEFQVRSMLLVPLVYQDQVMGFITVDEAARDHLFTSREVNVVQAIAAHCAVAIVHTRLAEAYRIERRRVLSLADALSDGIIILDRHLRIDTVSPAAEALLGWTSDEVHGKAASDVFDEGGVVREIESAALNVLAGAKDVRMILRFRAKDGSPVPCEVRAVAVPGTMGSTSEIVYALSRVSEGAEVTTRRPAKTGAG